jgi:hypothetical protein
VKITLSACSLLFALAIPCFAEPQAEVTFSGPLVAGAWQGQLDLRFAVPAVVDVTHSYWKHLVCVDAGNTDDQGPCLRWGCWASFSVPLRVEVMIRSSAFTSPPAITEGTLSYGFPQNDCQNPELELREAQSLRTGTTQIMTGIQTGASTTTGLAATAVSAILAPGTELGTARLTNFYYIQNESHVGLANPQVDLSEFAGTLKRVK